ncbi:uncharacterized protein BP01DRAFT_57906 [Aspergillus saccharolyticus JOP 1030-1]|uniref:Uncharacterized protein n=1 Tax=Aspergillus saccharolyticus JOP 1030-1 TaxID=1450539 RepID=A0A319ADB7_9EURO|nr:hypothetical protein BP01DRAFT_57906 [Aspergillus saccharolyticus JOP 1030-1]PYH44852.1 hypothetical protein BP01DRAFT_57906 [Aspergillus saccharolyticus JOP 1030-1]
MSGTWRSIVFVFGCIKVCFLCVHFFMRVLSLVYNISLFSSVLSLLSQAAKSVTLFWLLCAPGPSFPSSPQPAQDGDEVRSYSDHCSDHLRARLYRTLYMCESSRGGLRIRLYGVLVA